MNRHEAIEQACQEYLYFIEKVPSASLENIHHMMYEALALPDAEHIVSDGEPMGTRTVDEPEPVAYITQAALDALKRGASSSVRVWRKPDERLNGDIALYTKENE